MKLWSMVMRTCGGRPGAESELLAISLLRPAVRVGQPSYAYLMIAAEPGTVLFKPMACEGETSKGLERTKVECRKKSRLPKPILDPMLPGLARDGHETSLIGSMYKAQQKVRRKRKDSRRGPGFGEACKSRIPA